MRLLLWHVDSFVSRVTKRGRSSVYDLEPTPSVSMGEGVLVMASVERDDEGDPTGVAARAADEIDRAARGLKARSVTLHSFAHLFAELAAPEVARDVLVETGRRLADAGYQVSVTPFGWFNELEIRAKGHPYSRSARVIR